MTLLDNHPLLHVTLPDTAVDTTVKPSKTIQANIDLLTSREQVGLTKYGTTCDRTDFTHTQWLQHILEEQLDAANYIQAALRTAREANQDYAVLRQRLERELPRLEKADSFGQIDVFVELRRILFQDEADRVLRHARNR